MHIVTQLDGDLFQEYFYSFKFYLSLHTFEKPLNMIVKLLPLYLKSNIWLEGRGVNKTGDGEVISTQTNDLKEQFMLKMKWRKDRAKVALIFYCSWVEEYMDLVKQVGSLVQTRTCRWKDC